MSSIGIFCQDIREEKGGTESLIGVMLDNVQVRSCPTVLPKLCVYIRTHLPLDFDIQSFGAVLRLPDGEEISLDDSQPEFLEKARADARAAGSPLVGIIVKAVASPFRVAEAGLVEAIVLVNGERRLCGALNFKLAKESERPS